MKLQNKAISLGLWSEDYKKLAKWYADVLGFTIKAQADLSNDSFVAFAFGDNWFWIGKHEKVSGENKDPYRMMPEFYVESVEETYNELKERGVIMIATPFADPTDISKYCMTIADPEGNILQFYGPR